MAKVEKVEEKSEGGGKDARGDKEEEEEKKKGGEKAALAEDTKDKKGYNASLGSPPPHTKPVCLPAF